MSLIFLLAAETAASIAHYGKYTTKQLADNNNFWNVAIEQDMIPLDLSHSCKIREQWFGK